jgi:hypothetical protein
MFRPIRIKSSRLIPQRCSDIKAHISGSSMVLTGLATDAGMIDRSVQLARTFWAANVVNLIGWAAVSRSLKYVREVRRNIGGGWWCGRVCCGHSRDIIRFQDQAFPATLALNRLAAWQVTPPAGIISDNQRTGH